jgi:2-oxoglutarate dehydrogenase E1 component
MYITNCTTAANFFHALRRQINLPFRKPMINFSPKANLRLAKAFSPIEEFTQGGFKELIDDSTVSDNKKIKRVLLCSGKIFYELLDYKTVNNRDDIAILRLEQLHPLPVQQITELYQTKYRGAQWVWVQEEPNNMGAAAFLKMNLEDGNLKLGYLTRSASASTATGYAKKHKEEQDALIVRAFTL